MNEQSHSAIAAWLTQAGLAGESENAIVDGFCERCVKAGLPVARAHVFIDTLHPVHEGRLFRWGHMPNETPLLEYGRTVPVPDSTEADELAAERWRKSPFYRMLQTGESLMRRRVPAEGEETEFAAIAEMRDFGMTDYVAIIHRFAPEGVIGEMDSLYSSWATRHPDGFSDANLAALQRLTPYFALAIKSVSLLRMTGTLMQTYLGRDAGQRVLGGRIMRGVRPDRRGDLVQRPARLHPHH
jgi:adenylate cyclase